MYYNFSSICFDKRYHVVKGGRGSCRTNTYLYAEVILSIIADEVISGFRQISVNEERDFNETVVYLMLHKERARNIAELRKGEQNA